MTSPVSNGAPALFEEGSSPYAVKLPAFEGPLDLLLHLIRLDEIEITEIPIARVCEQYLEYLGLMRELDLEVAGEYLVMAATLAWIKSRMLLPFEGEGEEDEGVDPRAELVARLLEYQRFKEAAGSLAERRWLGRDVFRAGAPGPEPPPAAEREVEVGLFALLEAFRRALNAAGPSGVAHEVEVESVTVRERMVAVMRALESRPSLAFEEVLVGEDGRTSRSLVVATFLAILELSRLAVLSLYQGCGESGVPRGPIHLRPAELAGTWTELVAELT
jgi:segregation and condensation protein A